MSNMLSNAYSFESKWYRSYESYLYIVRLLLFNSKEYGNSRSKVELYQVRLLLQNFHTVLLNIFVVALFFQNDALNDTCI